MWCQAYPEKFYYEGIQDLQMPIQHQYLPVYFGNVCLRFIPVSGVMGWLGRVVRLRALDWRSKGRGFESRSGAQEKL